MRRSAAAQAGRIGIYVVIFLALAFGVSITYMYTREDPREVFKKNCNMRIEVVNGCGVDRLAIKVTDILREKGFNVVKIGNLDDQVFKETVIIERRSENMENVRYFSRRIGCKNIGRDVDAALYIDVTLILGEDYRKLFPDVEKKF
jgi:hypothetical protein